MQYGQTSSDFCIVASLMRPRWLFCGTLAATCLFNLLTALTQKSPHGTSHKPNPPPLLSDEQASFYSGQRWEYRRHTDNIWDDTFGSHFPPQTFFSSLKWNVSCSCLLANKNTEGSSHYWRLVKLPIRKTALGCFHLTMQSNCIIHELTRRDNTATIWTLDLAGAFKIPRVMDKDCWLDITSSGLNGWSWYIFRSSCKVIAFMGISKRNLHSLTLP